MTQTQTQTQTRIYSISNARITSTCIGYEAHGIFSVNVHFEGDGWSQGTGHYFAEKCLVDWIKGMLRVGEVERWEDLPGKLVKVKRYEPIDRIVAVGHVIKNVWYVLPGMEGNEGNEGNERNAGTGEESEVGK